MTLPAPVPTNRQDGTTIRANDVNVLGEAVNELIDHVDDLPPGGFSAYELALQNGFVGTQAEWLGSLTSTEPPTQEQVDEAVTPAVADAVATEVATLAVLDDGIGTRLRSTSGIVRTDRTIDFVKPVLTVGNTAAETTLIDGTKPVIPAGLLAGGAGLLRGTMFSAITNNSTTDRTVTIKAKLGTSTVFAWTTPALTSNASPRQVRLDFEMRMIDPLFGFQATGVGTLRIGAPGTGADAFQITRNLDPSPAIPLAAFDGPLTLDLTIQFSGAHANLSILNGYIHLDPMASI